MDYWLEIKHLQASLRILNKNFRLHLRHVVRSDAAHPAIPVPGHLFGGKVRHFPPAEVTAPADALNVANPEIEVHFSFWLRPAAVGDQPAFGQTGI